MARYYSTGKCIPGDGPQARVLYQRAADLSYPPAFYNIGVIDAAGQDYQDAETAFLKGATLGHRGCELMLGILYSLRVGVGDDVEAFAWLQLSLFRHDPASADAARAQLASVEARLSPTDREKADGYLIEIERQYGPIQAFRP
jgi:TPR repeat protein